MSIFPGLGTPNIIQLFNIQDVGEPLYQPTYTIQARAVSSTEAAALPNGEKALTPIIAGTISGTCVGTAWLVALIVAFVKCRRRKRRYKEVGDAEAHASIPDVFIVPPDPAVVQGTRQPGERIIIEKGQRWWRAMGRGKARSEGKGKDKELVPTAASEPPYFNRLSTILSVDAFQQTPIKGFPADEPPNGYFSQNVTNSSTHSGRVGMGNERCSIDSTVADAEPERSFRQAHQYPPTCS